MTDNKGERLQKVLARAGIASRRHAEDLITAGRVRVNGKVVDTLGARVASRRDKVEVDGVRIVAEAPVYLVFHKPRGVVTTLNDPEGRPTIKESLEGVAERVFPVGRLDFHTSGVLLLTNDGDLAQALLHPRRSVAKTYVAKVRGIVTDLQLEPWRTGMILPATPSDPDERPAPTLPADVRVLRTTPSCRGHGVYPRDAGQHLAPGDAARGTHPADSPHGRGHGAVCDAPRAHRLRGHHLGRAAAGPVAQPLGQRGHGAARAVPPPRGDGRGAGGARAAARAAHDEGREARGRARDGRRGRGDAGLPSWPGAAHAAAARSGRPEAPQARRA
jgi:23S rRNA pseudouridine2605 synthase